VPASASISDEVVVTRIEASRKHGHFDQRWPKQRLRITSDWRAAAAARLDLVPDGLDWAVFSACYFPGRRRLDLDAISAYQEYRHGRFLK
jgi:hypothetical protein